MFKAVKTRDTNENLAFRNLRQHKFRDFLTVTEFWGFKFQLNNPTKNLLSIAMYVMKVHISSWFQIKVNCCINMDHLTSFPWP